MRIQNMIRTSAIAVGIAAAALFLASSVRAQEIVNTEFSDGPNVATFPQPTTTVATAADANTTVTPMVAISTPVVTEEAMVSFENSAERWLMVSSVFGLAMLAVYAVAELRRANREMSMPARTSLTGRAALS